MLGELVDEEEPPAEFPEELLGPRPGEEGRSPDPPFRAGGRCPPPARNGGSAGSSEGFRPREKKFILTSANVVVGRGEDGS